MLARASERLKKIVPLPQPQRTRPKSIQASTPCPSDEGVFSIENLQLNGRQWVRLLSILCSVIQEDDFHELDVAKITAQIIDAHFQESPAFLEELDALLKNGGAGAQIVIDRLKQPPWER